MWWLNCSCVCESSREGGLQGKIVREWLFFNSLLALLEVEFSFSARCGMSNAAAVISHCICRLPCRSRLFKVLVFVPCSQFSSRIQYWNLMCSYRFSRRRSHSLIGRTSPAQPPAWCHFPRWPFTSLLRYAANCDARFSMFSESKVTS